MITCVDQKTYDLRGLHTDTKPITSAIGNGSTFFEMDTGDLYMYDQENQTWIKLGE